MSREYYGARRRSQLNCSLPRSSDSVALCLANDMDKVGQFLISGTQSRRLRQHETREVMRCLKTKCWRKHFALKWERYWKTKDRKDYALCTLILTCILCDLLCDVRDCPSSRQLHTSGRVISSCFDVKKEVGYKTQVCASQKTLLFLVHGTSCMTTVADSSFPQPLMSCMQPEQLATISDWKNLILPSRQERLNVMPEKKCRKKFVVTWSERQCTAKGISWIRAHNGNNECLRNEKFSSLRTNLKPSHAWPLSPICFVRMNILQNTECVINW